MVVVNLTGQLGNQMFQYTVGRKNQLLCRIVKYDLSNYKVYPNYWGLYHFNLDVPVATVEDVLKLKDERRTYPDRIRRKLFGRNPHVVSEIGRSRYDYEPSVFQYKNVFIDGYWQSGRYFIDIEDTIRRDFRFPLSDNPRNLELTEQMQKEMSVSIHVRRGDYLGGFPVMDMQYYNPAVDYFRTKYRLVHFYVFSKDMDWCRNNLKGDDISYVDWNIGKESIFDMYLMTQCKHNIIANSSFSWWGAWLNQYDGREVIAPKLWFYHTQTPDIYC